jgi:phosphate starvation-inducible protein PhoH and related proteins
MSKKNKRPEVTENETTFKKITLSAKTDEQREVIKSIKNNEITFIHGCPGSGKSHLAVVYGLKELLACRYKQLIFTRPCKESMGEKLGSLPGDSDDKIAPYMMPLFEILKQYISQKEIDKYVNEGLIRMIPLAYYRGITFNNSFIVADEFQNTIPEQMRLFLTRFGKNSKIVITGDVRQSDIGRENGMADAMNRLQDIKGIAFNELTSKSIVRHPIISDIEDRYNSKTIS